MFRVLVIDDDAKTQALLCELIAAGGHDPVVGGRGLAALRDILELDFDLVLTDLSMPQVTGWNLVDWVAEHRPGTPVVAVSGIYRDLHPAWTKRFDAFLAKPVSLDLLARTIETVARKADLRGQRAGSGGCA